MIALLPPSSSSERPMRCATRSPTMRPTLVEPVKLISGMRWSSTKLCAMSVPASLNRKNRSGKPAAFSASLQIFIDAIADSGVFGDGFQIEMSPQIAARNAFHAHTATGKLNALMMPTRPSGCHCSYMRWPGALRMHRVAVQHARLADREVGDVDHFLHFAVAFGLDLAHLERDQRTRVRPCACARRRRTGESPRRDAVPASCARSRTRPAPA